MTGERRFQRARVRLAGAMWLPVLIANVIAIALATGLPSLDRSVGSDIGVPIAVSAAQQIFGALASGMITFTGIVFSAVFVAAQIQTSSYSPRLAARLRRDPVVIAGLALPTATATYALVALAAVSREGAGGDPDFVPAITVVTALVLLVVTLGAFVALVQRAFEQTQIGGILHSLMRRAAAVIDDVHPAGAAPVVEPPPARDEVPPVVVRHEGHPAVVAAVDRAALLRLAAQSGGFVEVVPMVGHYVSAGTPVVRVHDARDAPDAARGRRILVLARQRTIDQDPAFVIRMLVDIAIRALSPAVNDPTTAVQVLDRIETLLLELHGRRPGPWAVLDAAGVPRGACSPPPGATTRRSG